MKLRSIFQLSNDREKCSGKKNKDLLTFKYQNPISSRREVNMITKNNFLSLLIMLSCLLSSALLAQDESKISLDYPEDFFKYPMLSFHLGENKKADVYTVTVNPDSKTFKKTTINSGTEANFSGYILSRNIYDLYSGFLPGGDLPQFQKIKSILDSGDKKEFIELLKKINEERLYSDNATNPSGYLEITGTMIPNSNKDFRYFVASKDLVDGKIDLDLKKSKITFLQSVFLYLYKKSDQSYNYNEDNNELTKIHDDLEKLSTCNLSNCVLNAPLGGLLESMLQIVTSTSESDLTNVDFKEMNTLALRKEMCLLRSLLLNCGLNASEVNAIIKKQKINCELPKSLTKGL